MKNSHTEIVASALVAIAAFALATHFALFKHISKFAAKHQAWHTLDSIFAMIICASSWTLFLSLRKSTQLRCEIDRSEAAEKLAYSAARHDPLTGLPNSLFFSETVATALSEATRLNGKCAVLFIDLDQFKPVNDAHGHDVGDDLLIEVGNRMRAIVPTARQVARLGGDEFGIVVDVDEVGANHVRDCIAQCLGKPITIGELSLSIDATIGIAIGPKPDMSSEALIRSADIAMYDHKRARGNPRARQAA